MQILDCLGLRPRKKGEEILCTIPPRRGDLRREVDLIEEIARHVGYERIPVAGRMSHAISTEPPWHRARRRAGQVLAAAGFDEAVTFTFVDDEEAWLFVPGPAVKVDAAVRKSNNSLRKTLLNSLLRACKTNQDAGNAAVALFEIAAVFAPSGGALPEEHLELGMVTTGDVRRLRGALEALTAALCPLSALSVAECDAPGLAAGTAAEVLLDGERFGAVGLVDAAVQDFYELERPVAAAAVDFRAVLARAEQRRRYQPLPKFPAVTRDLSLIVEESVTWKQLVEAIESVEQPARVALDYVTTYRGKPVPKGKKSVTASLTYRSPDGTLRGEQVDEQVEAVVRAAGKALKAELRV